MEAFAQRYCHCNPGVFQSTGDTRLLTRHTPRGAFPDLFGVRVWALIPASLFPDTCYVLSFAIIMLNTSLHNPNVRDKPGVDRFISMNRGINEGGDLPEDLLRVWGLLCLRRR